MELEETELEETEFEEELDSLLDDEDSLLDELLLDEPARLLLDDDPESPLPPPHAESIAIINMTIADFALILFVIFTTLIHVGIIFLIERVINQS